MAWIRTLRSIEVLFVCLLGTAPFAWGASFEKDPIKETQTDPVPVTEELLAREGQTGPASPTFKIGNTAEFLVQKPYGNVEVGEQTERPKKEYSPWWEGWLFWKKDGENSSNSVTN